MLGRPAGGAHAIQAIASIPLRDAAPYMGDYTKRQKYKFRLVRLHDLELSGKSDLHGRFAVNPEISLFVQMNRL
jgi:hypothetical protein